MADEGKPQKLTFQAPGKLVRREVVMNDNGSQCTVEYDEGTILVITLTNDGVIDVSSPNRVLAAKGEELVILHN
jgi:hypothetical protein